MPDPDLDALRQRRLERLNHWHHWAATSDDDRVAAQLLHNEEERDTLLARLDAVTAWLEDFKRAGTPMAGIVAAQYADRLAAVLTGEARHA